MSQRHNNIIVSIQFLILEVKLSTTMRDRLYRKVIFACIESIGNDFTSRNDKMLTSCEKKTRVSNRPGKHRCTSSAIRVFKECKDTGYYSLKKYPKALIWYKKAAAYKSSEAKNMIGWMYHHGEGVAQNHYEDRKWYLKADDTDGNNCALNNIGYLHLHGEGIVQSTSTAIEWFKKAVKQGNHFAGFNLAWVYEYEKQFEDPQKAVNWYQQSADSGEIVSF